MKISGNRSHSDQARDPGQRDFRRRILQRCVKIKHKSLTSVCVSYARATLNGRNASYFENVLFTSKIQRDSRDEAAVPRIKTAIPVNRVMSRRAPAKNTRSKDGSVENGFLVDVLNFIPRPPRRSISRKSNTISKSPRTLFHKHDDGIYIYKPV